MELTRREMVKKRVISLVLIYCLINITACSSKIVIKNPSSDKRFDNLDCGQTKVKTKQDEAFEFQKGHTLFDNFIGIENDGNIRKIEKEEIAYLKCSNKNEQIGKNAISSGNEKVTKGAIVLGGVLLGMGLILLTCMIIGLTVMGSHSD